MNKAAERFVKGLKSNWHFMSKDAMDFYLEKLERWSCTVDQWNGALDSLIQSGDPERVPDLKAIYDELKRQQRRTQTDNNYGWATFVHKGYSKAIRIRAIGGVWCITDLVSRDANGAEKHHHQHVGEPVINHIPSDAENFHIAPDNPAWPRPNDLPTPEEVSEYVTSMRMNTIRIGDGNLNR